MATSDEWALCSTLTLKNADPFLKRLKKAKPKLFKPGGTNLRLETVPLVDDHDPQPGLSDVVTDDQQLGSTLQVGFLLIYRLFGISSRGLTVPQKHLELRGETFMYAPCRTCRGEILVMLTEVLGVF